MSAHRRQFLLGTIGLLAARRALSQPAKVHRIGLLIFQDRAAKVFQEFQEGLRDFGYIEGTNVMFIGHPGDGTPATLAAVAKDIVEKNVDVIVTGVNPSTDAARLATSRIPIVMLIGTNVIGAGYSRSLGRPDGNITGVTWDVGDTIAKRLELLKEAVPGMSRVAILFEPPYGVSHREGTEKAASTLGLRTVWLEYSGTPEQDLGELKRAKADGVYMLNGVRAYRTRQEIAAAALKYQLPTLFTASYSVEAGGLMSYAPSLDAVCRSAGRFIDKILKGATPADIPIEQPAKIELVLNRKTAKALGLSLSETFLIRADRVID